MTLAWPFFVFALTKMKENKIEHTATRSGCVGTRLNFFSLSDLFMNEPIATSAVRLSLHASVVKFEI